jgi:ring-1,2-phenylacetyl-CoA epoxidase subunit PaaE
MSFDNSQINKFAQMILASVTQSLLSQILVISVFYVLIWYVFAHRLRRFRIQKVKRAGGVQLRKEFGNTLIVILANVATTPLILVAQQLGWTKIYVDLNQYGLVYFIFSTILVFLISDAWFYWIHRALHHPKIYRYIHAVHHESLDTTPFTSLSFHFLEPLLLSAWIYIVIFLFPISIAAIGINQVIGLLNNIKSHLGYEFYPKWFEKTPLKYLVNSTHHNQHHTRYNGNYGLAFRFWDIAFKTEFDDYDQLVAKVKNSTNSVMITKNSVYHKLKISQIKSETSDTCSVYFEPTDERFYNYLPGQYINLRVKVGKIVYDRIFSLSSSPYLDKFLRITVKKHSVVTNYFLTKAKVGDEIEALYPCGDFNLELSRQASKNYLLIAGGSGITPLYSMLRSILQIEKESHITLLYANKTSESIIFGEELSKIQDESANLKVEHFISSQKRRLSKTDLEKYLKTYPDPQIFVCGPDSLKKATKDYLKELQFAKGVNEEDFADGYVGFLTAFKNLPA